MNEARRRLHVAVRSGNINNVKGVLSVCDRNTASRAIWLSGSPLHGQYVHDLNKPVLFTAVEEAHHNILALFCIRRWRTVFKPWTCTYGGMSIVGYTIATGRTRLLDTLLQNQKLIPDWTGTVYKESTPFIPNVACSSLFVALQCRDYHAVKCLLKANISPVAPLWQPNGTSPLVYAIASRDCMSTANLTKAISENRTMSNEEKAAFFTQGKDAFSAEGLVIASDNSMSLFINSEDMQHYSRLFSDGRRRLIITPEEAPAVCNPLYMVTRLSVYVPQVNDELDSATWVGWMCTVVEMFGRTPSQNILNLIRDALDDQDSNSQIRQVCKWVETSLELPLASYILEQLVEECASEHVPVELPQRMINTVRHAIDQGRCLCDLPFGFISHCEGLLLRVLNKFLIDDIIQEEREFYQNVLDRMKYSEHNCRNIERFMTSMSAVLQSYTQQGINLDEESTFANVLFRMVRRAYRQARPPRVG